MNFNNGSYYFPSSVLPTGLLLGGVVIADLVKPETSQAVQMLHHMGLRVALVTGDNRRTAHALAEEVGQHTSASCEIT